MALQQDGSIEIIKKYENRLAYWVSEKDNGQADAINKGLARANGEILAWLNSDDYYLPNTISAVVKVFEENPDVVMLYGDMLAVDEHGQTINALKYKQLSLEDLLCFQIIGQPAVFFRRDALKKRVDSIPLSTFYSTIISGFVSHNREKFYMFHKHGLRRVIMPKPRTAPKPRVRTRSLPHFGLGEESSLV